MIEMTIDQLNEIQEWLSPLDKYPTITWGSITHPGFNNQARVNINTPSNIICLYFSSEKLGVAVENTIGRFELISTTSIWEQICLRVL
jgi:hypothetical protein